MSYQLVEEGLSSNNMVILVYFFLPHIHSFVPLTYCVLYYVVGVEEIEIQKGDNIPALISSGGYRHETYTVIIIIYTNKSSMLIR